MVLSACQTGRGRDVGGDGLLGFGHAFLSRGARCVVLSRWKVDDAATSLLIFTALMTAVFAAAIGGLVALAEIVVALSFVYGAATRIGAALLALIWLVGAIWFAVTKTRCQRSGTSAKSTRPSFAMRSIDFREPANWLSLARGM